MEAGDDPALLIAMEPSSPSPAPASVSASAPASDPAEGGWEKKKNNTNFRHNSTILPGSPAIAKVTSLAWSPNGRKLAVVTISRIIYLFDETGILKEKFPTKPADPKGSKLYIVIGMVFSPDSTKLAIGQSDDIIFIYKLGLDWGDKKSICNKFQQTVPINSIVWPHSSQNGIVFGLSDGKVKVGQLRTNRTTTIHAHGACSSVVTLACSPDGCTCLAGHLDGSIYRFILDKDSQAFAVKLMEIECLPVALCWGKSIVVVGSDSKVFFYDINGACLQVLECYLGKGFTSASINSTGETVVLGCYNGFHTFQNSGINDVWEDAGQYEVKNLYTVSAIAWKPDGSQLAVGSLCGNVDLYDAFLRTVRYSDKFEFNYISKDQVVLTQLPMYSRMLLQSEHGYEILKINIYMDQFLIAHTEETLLLGDIKTCKLSEVAWHGNGNERFLLDNPSVCLIYDNGELSIIEYGCNGILTTIQTDHLQEALISVRLHNKISCSQPVKHGHNRIAYLLDLLLMQVKDVFSGDIVQTIAHNCEIVWLQLNPRASHLLFCDKKGRLHIFDIDNQGPVKTLLDICNFVQWVPDTDVVIAQSQLTLYIWYSLEDIQHATKFQLKGDLEGVQRLQGHTEILVFEGSNTVAYELDQRLIDISLDLKDMELDRALTALKYLELTEETRFMWKQLSGKSLQQMKFLNAEESYACAGDVCRSMYLHKVNKMTNFTSKEDLGHAGKGQYRVHVALATLLKNWKDAEKFLLDCGHIENAIQMHLDGFRWNEAISVSRAYDFDSKALYARYLSWLLDTNQIEEAGNEKLLAGEVKGAIELFLRGSLLGLAANNVSKLPAHQRQGQLFDKITEGLTNLGMFDKLGELMESLGDHHGALRVYQNGHCYHHAVELAHKNFKNNVCKIQEVWADWLASKYQMDAAIKMYLELGYITKAVELAIASYQWSKAIQIVSLQKNVVAVTIYVRLAQHFEKLKQLPEAESLFIMAKLPSEALRMYLKQKKYEAAQKVAAQFLSTDESCVIYVGEAKQLEASRQFKHAEKLYVEAGQYDLAINMYKKGGLWDKVVQLVAKYRKDELKELHIELAQDLEQKGMLRDAEHHYLKVYDWKSVLKMYSISAMWEDALRIARSWGDTNAIKQVAYAWAISCGGNNGLEAVVKLGFLNGAIEYAVDVGAFNNAFHLCSAASSEKLEEVHLDFAKFLQGKGRFKEAEDNFIKGGQPREAIDMYIQQEDWEAAFRVADLFLPSAIPEIQVSQAQVLSDSNEIKKAEALFIQAKKPDLAIDMYKARNMWDEAIRFAQNYLPSKLSDLQYDFAVYLHSNGNGVMTLESILIKAKSLESSQNFEEAIQMYLQIDIKLLPDMEKLQKVWRKTLSLAREHAKEQLAEVIHTISEHLARAGQHQEAAELFLEYNDLEEAANVYIMGNYWDKARKVAECFDQDELCEYIENRYKQHLLKTGEAQQFANMGSIHEALHLYSENENWDKVHNLSEMIGLETQRDSSARHAEHCMKNAKVFEAASIISQYGLPHTSKGSELCESITSQLLHYCNDAPTSMLAMQKWRSFLYGHIQNIKVSNNQPACQELETLLLPLTYTIQRFFCQQKHLKELAAKLSISLLRFIQNIPVDKAFFEAGVSCKEVNWTDKAFVYFNQYLDIAEAIDDAEPRVTVDHPILRISDLPSKLTVPKEHFVEVAKQEEVKEWAIQFSVNQQVGKSCMTRECEVCKHCIYEASLQCFNCKSESKACCVTGYPLNEGGQIECQACHMLANEGDWLTYVGVFHACPWCNAHAEAFTLQLSKV